MRAGVLIVTALLGAAVGAAPAAEPQATAAAACRGSLTAELGGKTFRVHSIRTTAMSCRSGKRLIRRFFAKADENRRCRRRAEKLPPSPGCAVARFHCWRGIAKYCARPGHDVSWRDRRA